MNREFLRCVVVTSVTFRAPHWNSEFGGPLMALPLNVAQRKFSLVRKSCHGGKQMPLNRLLLCRKCTALVFKLGLAFIKFLGLQFTGRWRQPSLPTRRRGDSKFFPRRQEICYRSQSGGQGRAHGWRRKRDNHSASGTLSSARAYHWEPVTCPRPMALEVTQRI